MGSGGLGLENILPVDVRALVTAGQGEAGSVRTQILDVDLRRRNDSVLPVRLLNKVAFSADGQPGSSRTLVLDR